MAGREDAKLIRGQSARAVAVHLAILGRAITAKNKGRYAKIRTTYDIDIDISHIILLTRVSAQSPQTRKQEGMFICIQEEGRTLTCSKLLEHRGTQGGLEEIELLCLAEFPCHKW